MSKAVGKSPGPAGPGPGVHGGGGLCLARKDRAGIAARFVGTSFRSFASPQAAKLTPSTVPLLPSRHCDSRAKLARQSRRSFFPARFIRHWRRFAGKLSPPNPLRWASAGPRVHLRYRRCRASGGTHRDYPASLGSGCAVPTWPAGPPSVPCLRNTGAVTVACERRRRYGVSLRRRYVTCRTARGKIQKGGRNPLLGRFKGWVKGGENRNSPPFPFFPPISSGRNGGARRVGASPGGHPR